MIVNRGVGIAHYNRLDNLPKIIEAVKKTTPERTKIVVADDGSDGDVSAITKKYNVILIQGPNKGVAYNKNRVLYALKKCHFIAILEDDLYPTESGWFNQYETATVLSDIHHWCRVQDKNKEIPENVPEFTSFLSQNNLTPIYGSSPRGDLTFISSRVITQVGGFDKRFKGAGYAHGSWSNRVVRAGLVKHPLKFIDIRESRDMFSQIGDTTGGRFDRPKREIKEQLDHNKIVYQEIEKSENIYQPIELE